MKTILFATVIAITMNPLTSNGQDGKDKEKDKLPPIPPEVLATMDIDLESEAAEQEAQLNRPKTPAEQKRADEIAKKVEEFRKLKWKPTKALDDVLGDKPLWNKKQIVGVLHDLEMWLSVQPEQFHEETKRNTLDRIYRLVGQDIPKEKLAKLLTYKSKDLFVQVKEE